LDEPSNEEQAFAQSKDATKEKKGPLPSSQSKGVKHFQHIPQISLSNLNNPY
jgi:hypothetical protein